MRPHSDPLCHGKSMPWKPWETPGTGPWHSLEEPASFGLQGLETGSKWGFLAESTLQSSALEGPCNKTNELTVSDLKIKLVS